MSTAGFHEVVNDPGDTSSNGSQAHFNYANYTAESAIKLHWLRPRTSLRNYSLFFFKILSLA